MSLRFELASTLISGIGDKLSKLLISYCGSPQEIFEKPVSYFRKIPGIGEKAVVTIQNQREQALTESDKIIADCHKKGIEILHYTSEKYPERLKLIPDAPPILYVKGNDTLKHHKSVAIVGSRKATDYGRRVTEEIVDQLKVHQPVIISGLAYGIDIAAHKAAIKNDLNTIGVMACGLDRVYPNAHGEIARRMESGGGLISENKPGTKPDFHYFPARNRIIAGMADVVIVVEAAKKGGALITADIAYGYEKTLFAVPGNLGSTYSEGCNYLIKSQKASIYTSISDLEYLLHWEPDGKPVKKVEINLDSFNSKEEAIIRILLTNPEGILIDELAWKTQISINEIASLLLTLEFQGFVKSLPGKRFKLKK